MSRAGDGESGEDGEPGEHQCLRPQSRKMTRATKREADERR